MILKRIKMAAKNDAKMYVKMLNDDFVFSRLFETVFNSESKKRK